jgi:hypothetical protein
LKRVETDDKNEQYHLSLGAAYLQAGNRPLAIQQIRRVIELDPNFKSQGESLIRDIQAGRNPVQ